MLSREKLVVSELLTEKGSQDKRVFDLRLNAYSSFGPVYVKNIMFRANMYRQSCSEYYSAKDAILTFLVGCIIPYRKRKI